MLAHVLSFWRNPRLFTGLPGVSCSQSMPAAWSWYWGSEVFGCRTLRLESQDSTGIRMQPYPRAPGHVWPGHLHGTGCLSARAMDTVFSYRRVGYALGFGVCPPLAPTDLGFGFGTCPGLGLCLSASGPGRGRRCVPWMWAAPGSSQLGWPRCAGDWARVAGLVAGMKVGASLPSLHSRLEVVVCAPLWAGTLSAHFLVGFAGGARGLGFPLYPAGPALAVWCLVLSGISLTPAHGALSAWLGCVAVLCGAAPSLVPGACPVRAGGPPSTWVVVRPCLSKQAVLSAMRGCVGAPWAAVPPPLVNFFWPFPRGTICPLWRGGDVAWWPCGLCRLSLAVPPPLCMPFLFFFRAPSAGGLPLSLPGLCRCVRGVFSATLSADAWSWWAAWFGWRSLGWVGWSFGVLFVGPVGVAHGVARLQGGLSASPLWVCVFPVVWLFLPLSGVPAGRRVCVRGAGRAVWPIPFRRLVGFPPFPVLLVCFLVFLRGGLPSLSMHWSESGVVNWLAVRVAGVRGPCPAPCALWLMYTHGLVARCVGPGSGSAGWAVAPAGFVGSWVRGGAGRGWGDFLGVPSVPPPLWRRLGAGGFDFLLVVCAGGRLLAVGGGCVPYLLVVPGKEGL